MALAAYSWENENYPKYQRLDVPFPRAKEIVAELSVYFKVEIPSVQLKVSRKFAGVYRRSETLIKLNPDEYTIGTILHEFAHHLNWVVDMESGHAKTFKRQLKRVYKWADTNLCLAGATERKRKEWGSDEITKVKNHMVELEKAKAEALAAGNQYMARRLRRRIRIVRFWLSTK